MLALFVVWASLNHLFTSAGPPLDGWRMLGLLKSVDQFVSRCIVGLGLARAVSRVGNF
jgi:hypothetical protein